MEFDILSERLNNVLRVLDLPAAEQYEKLRQAAGKELPYLRALHRLDPCFWQGRILLFNRMTPPHKDLLNPPAEWTPLHAAGNFTTGGSLYVDELRLRVRYLPGDLIFLRGRCLTHYVERWEGGQRISAVYFTHESFWGYFNQRLSL